MDDNLLRRRHKKREEASEKALDASGDRIRQTLLRFYAETSWQPVENQTPLQTLIDGETGGELDEWGCRHEVLVALLDWLCEDGVHPGAVLRRIYAVGKALNRPPWSLLSLEETGQMFGETRAAMSWRIKKIFSGYLKKKGFRGFKAPFQKDEEAVASFAKVQKGNRNRRKKPGRRISKKTK